MIVAHTRCCTWNLLAYLYLSGTSRFQLISRFLTSLQRAVVLDVYHAQSSLAVMGRASSRRVIEPRTLSATVLPYSPPPAIMPSLHNARVHVSSGDSDPYSDAYHQIIYREMICTHSICDPHLLLSLLTPLVLCISPLSLLLSSTLVFFSCHGVRVST